MNKIKILFIAILASSITNSFCGIIENVEDSIAEIDANLVKIDTTVKTLKNTHNQLKTQLINSINDQIQNNLTPAIKETQSSIKGIDDIPGRWLVDRALFFLGLGDMKKTLQSIVAALVTTKLNLHSIEMSFQEYVNDLDPNINPETNIYSKFEESRVNLVTTRNSLKEMLPLLRLFE